jgi:hypothetical protein
MPHRVSDPVTWEDAVDLCSGEDAGCDFCTPEEAVDLFIAIEEAGLPLPEGDLRVDAFVTPEDPTAWVNSAGDPAPEGPFDGFTPAECDFADYAEEQPDIMTCGINFQEQTFTCLLPSQEVPAILGSISIPPTTVTPPPPAGSCPLADEDPNWLYVNEDFCLL